MFRLTFIRRPRGEDFAFWWAAHRFKGHKLLYGTERPILSPHHMEMVGWVAGFTARSIVIGCYI